MLVPRFRGRDRRGTERPRIAGVRDDQRLTHVHRAQEFGDGRVRDPAGRLVRLAIDREPVATAAVRSGLPVAGIVDEQVVLVVEPLAQIVEGGEHIVAARVGQERRLKAVPVTKDARDFSRSVRGPTEPRQRSIVVVADHEGVVFPERKVLPDRSGRCRNLRGRRRRGQGRHGGCECRTNGRGGFRWRSHVLGSDRLPIPDSGLGRILRDTEPPFVEVTQVHCSAGMAGFRGASIPLFGLGIVGRHAEPLFVDLADIGLGIPVAFVREGERNGFPGHRTPEESPLVRCR